VVQQYSLAAKLFARYVSQTKASLQGAMQTNKHNLPHLPQPKTNNAGVFYSFSEGYPPSVTTSSHSVQMSHQHFDPAAWTAFTSRKNTFCYTLWRCC